MKKTDGRYLRGSPSAVPKDGRAGVPICFPRLRFYSFIRDSQAVPKKPIGNDGAILSQSLRFLTMFIGAEQERHFLKALRGFDRFPRRLISQRGERVISPILIDFSKVIFKHLMQDVRWQGILRWG